MAITKAKKKKLFTKYGIQHDEFTMPDGEVLKVTELTLEQQGGYAQAFEGGARSAQVYLVCCGFDDFNEQDQTDIDGVSQIKQALLSEMAEKVLEVSGLKDKEGTEKKP